MIRVKKPGERASQGDIIRNVELIESIHERDGIIEASKIIFPLVIVLTQDCDLAQDHRLRLPSQNVANQDKLLFSVLVAPLYNAEHVYSGEHLSDISMKMQQINKKATPGQTLRNNETPK
jgi:hypothetical protein